MDQQNNKYAKISAYLILLTLIVALLSLFTPFIIFSLPVIVLLTLIFGVIGLLQYQKNPTIGGRDVSILVIIFSGLAMIGIAYLVVIFGQAGGLA